MTLAIDDPLFTGNAAINPGPQGQAEDDEDWLIAFLPLSLADAPAASRLWDSLAPPRYRGWLSATPVPSARAYGGTLPPLWFDEREQRFGLGRRGYVTREAAADALEAFRSTAQDRARADVGRVYTGETEIGAWQNATAEWLNLLALAAVAYGVGGIARLDEAILRDASQRLRFHLDRLQRFAQAMELRLVTAEAAERRAAMYPAAVITVQYDEARRDSHVAVGFYEELNVLAKDADHCQTTPETPGCADLAELGWVPIGTIPLPGRRTCAMNCKCRMDYRRRDNDE